MNKNRINAAITIMKGVLKIAIARLTGNTRLENDGRIEKARGKFQDIAARGMDVLKKH